MFHLKKIIQIFFAIFAVFITMHANATFLAKQTPTRNAPTQPTCSKKTNKIKKQKCESSQISSHGGHRKRSEDPYNGTLWVGGGFLFFPSTMGAYIQGVTVDYQLGVSKSMYNITRNMFFYWAAIFDYAYSNQRLGTNAAGMFYKAKYHFTNEQFLLGYETALGIPYIAFFIEGGGAFQQRTFSIVQNPPSHDITTGFGGSMNVGLNLRIVPENHTSYLFRIACNFMLGGRRELTVAYNAQRININPVSIVPSLSFGIRI